MVRVQRLYLRCDCETTSTLKMNSSCATTPRRVEGREEASVVVFFAEQDYTEARPARWPSSLSIINIP
jgi:hypothetical protein